MNGQGGTGTAGNHDTARTADLRARRLVVALFALLLLAFDCGAVFFLRQRHDTMPSSPARIALARLAETPDDCAIAPDMALFAGLPMNLNRADRRDLMRLPGIGPVLAERITARRAALGGFTSLDELADVPGLGEGTLQRLRPHLCLR